MTTHTVTLDDLERLAFDSGAQIAVDSTQRKAYLRRGRVLYVAPLAELEQAS